MVMGSLTQDVEVAVVGAGPGGYTAAIRAADLGREVVLVEERERPGGVCLLEGCIPSKTLIHAVEIVEAARRAEIMGVSFTEVRVEPSVLRAWTGEVVEGLSKGISHLLARRGVEVIRGRGRLADGRTLAIEGGEVSALRFEHCILATGSRIHTIPEAYDLPVWSSAEALALTEVPERLVVVGGGYIGLEMGLVYAGLGSRVTLVEFFPRLLMGADPDLVDVVVRYSSGRFEAVLTDSRVTGMEKTAEGFALSVEHGGETRTLEADRVLVATGRRPNTEELGLEKAGIALDEQGRIPVSPEARTAAERIFAVGDITPGPMLAHKASREGKVAAEVIAGQPSAYDNRAVPAVVFTDPELAWTGLTEREATERKIPVQVGRFPLSALGRAHTMGRKEGFVKVLSDPEGGTLLGFGMVGPHASELVAEATLAIEMGATIEDLLSTIHPHPTLSEALLEAAEATAGAAVHLPPKKKGKSGEAS